MCLIEFDRFGSELHKHFSDEPVADGKESTNTHFGYNLYFHIQNKQHVNLKLFINISSIYIWLKYYKNLILK